MQPINIFYHMYCINDCYDRFNKTFSKIQQTDLLETCTNLFVGLVGPLANDIQTKIENLSEKIKCIKFENSSGEMETLRFLWEESLKNPTGASLYLHSKGVSKGVNSNISSWVDYMEYFCINRYKFCLLELLTHDTVGVNLQHQPMKHYSGNFWWATNKYIQTLPKLDVLKSNNRSINDERWYCEFWILDSQNVKSQTLHQSPVNHYCSVYDKANYEQSVEKNS